MGLMINKCDGYYSWSIQPPKVPGWYLAVENLDLEDRDIMLIYVTDDGVINKIGYWGGNISIPKSNNTFSFNHFSHWLGPIAYPRGT